MICSYMHNMHEMHNMQTNMQHPCFNMQHPHFNMLNMLSMSKNISSMDTPPLFFQNTKNNLKHASQNGLRVSIKTNERTNSKRAYPPGVGPFWDFIIITEYVEYAKYAKVVHILCTARPFGRSPLYCCSGHVRTRTSNNIHSGLLWQCKTTSSA